MGGHLKTVLGRLWVDELFVAHLEANYRDDAVECAEYSVYGNCGESQGTGTREKWRVCWGIARGSPKMVEDNAEHTRFIRPGT